MTQEELLLHYGVKGMKWGVRKPRRTIAKEYRYQKNSLKRQGRLAKSAVSITKLSNKQLDRKLKRIQTENSIQQIAKNRKTSIPIRLKARELYRNKENMKGEDLQKRLSRLKKEQALYSEIMKSTKTSRKVIETILGAAIKTARERGNQ